MEKPNRDFTHAMRAEEEYRNLITQYPDSKLVPEAKDRLRQVQEVLAEREFRIGHFYFMRESWAAAIARLQSVVDDYPLYSGADESLYLLGSAYERHIDTIRASKFDEVAKGKMIKGFGDQAAEAYARILTRYPDTDRAGDARKRLEALHRPVPTPTPEAIAQNKREEESRHELGRLGKLRMNLHRGPDTSLAVKVGEPTLVDPKPTNAPDIVKATTAAIMAAASGKTGGGETGTGSVSVETVKSGAPLPNQPVPRSEAQPGTAPADNSADSGVPKLRSIPSADSNSAGSDTGTSSAAAGSLNKGQGPAAPAQVNEAAGDQGNAAASSSNASPSSSNDKDTASSSKKKKKKGLGRLNPF